MIAPVTLTVFTKPWKCPLPELARHVAELGFDGVELPVRPGYPVTPDNIAAELPRAVQTFANHGLKVASIAGPTAIRCQEGAILCCDDRSADFAALLRLVWSDTELQTLWQKMHAAAATV